MSSSESIATRLSGDAIAEIVKWLPSDVLGALVLCGDVHLNHHLSHHIHTVTCRNTLNHFTWPFYIRGWKGLKHLSVTLDATQDIQRLGIVWMPRFAARIAESLPTSLESLHLNGLSKLFRSIMQNLLQKWNLTRHPTTTTHSKPPNLNSFTFIRSVESTESIQPIQCNSLVDWIKSVEGWSTLTHLSLGNLILSSLNQPLCNVLPTLPRAITNLDLHVDNSENRPLFHQGATSAYNNDDLFASALPPHLTRLKLGLTVASHIPPALLSRLSDLNTLSLSVEYYYPQIDEDPTGVLSRLPPNVTKLSLNGFLGTDLQCYMDSIPDAHCSLRQLTIKNVDIASGLRFLNPAQQYLAVTNGRIDMYAFLRTLTSCPPKFKQLEALHVMSNYDKIAILDDRYDALSDMTRLRSVSSIFLRPCFDAFWKCIAAFVTIGAPMNVRSIRRNDNELLCDAIEFNRQWLQNVYFQTTAIRTLPLHLAIDHLVLCDQLCRVLVPYKVDESSPSSPPPLSDAHAAALFSTFKTVKHLTMSSNDDNIDILTVWPGGCLESLNIEKCSFVAPIESIFTPTIANCVRTLRVLKIDVQLDTTHLSTWLSWLPETLETLRIWRVRIVDAESNFDNHRQVQRQAAATHILPNEHILTYIPPRLQTMNIHGGFAIGEETFNVMPPSLRDVHWSDVLDIFCGTRDLCRWPQRTRTIYLDVIPGTCVSSSDSVHCNDNLKEWAIQSSYLKFAHISYIKSDNESVLLEHKR